MVTIEQIPHLALYKQKVEMPMVNIKTRNLLNMVILDNKNYSALNKFINHPNIVKKNIYNFYYMDFLYTGTIANKNYRENLKKERQLIYDNIQKQNKGIIAKPLLTGINDKNMYRDMYFNNEIFFKRSTKLPRLKRVEAYIEEIKKVIEDERFSNYRKTIVVDVEDWLLNVKELGLLDNPMSILFIGLWKRLDVVKSLGDVNIVFYTSKHFLRMNPKDCDKDSYKLLRRGLGLLHSKMSLISDPEFLTNLERKEELVKFAKENILKSYNLTGDSEIDDEINEAIDKAIDENMDDESFEPTGTGTTNLEEKLKDDKELNTSIYNFINTKASGKTTMSNKRDEELRKNQANIKVGNMTISEMRELAAKEPILEAKDVSAKVKTLNTNVTKIKYPQFDKTYNEKLYKHDILGVFESLNRGTIPVYILKVDIEDSSNDLNYKETWTITMEDSNRVRHTVKVDVPKFIDDKYLYLNGNRKMIVRQLFSKPVVKTSPDTVQIVSNYNKIFIRREGQKLTDKIEKLHKMFSTTHKGIVVKQGNVFHSNNDYITTIEYDELSKHYGSVKLGNAEFIFDQSKVHEKLNELKIKPKEGFICVGFEAGKPIYLDTNGLDDVTDLMIPKLPTPAQADFESLSVGKKFIYSTATIMKKKTPLIFLLSFYEGLSQVLWKAEIEHYFTDKRPQLQPHQNYIRFRNGYLVYSTSPIQNSFLMNAFYSVPTQAYDYEEFDKQDVYLEIFETIYGHKNVGMAFINYYNSMLDNITLEVLEKLNYPTDFVKLVLFANKLLADNRFMKENNLNMYRVRSNEIISSLLYSQIADAYARYLSTANNNRPVKISIPKDIVLKNIMTNVLTEDYSTLNPISELDKSRAITPKGPSGLNVKEAYTPDKRSYDKTMLGLMAMSTSPDANVGVVRKLALEPNIINARGYIDLEDDHLEKLKDSNLFCPAELLTPIGASRDDSVRTAMSTKQSSHIVPIVKSSPVLISNGVEQVIPYHLGKDFVIVAEDDGEVVEVNDKTGFTIVRYKNGKHIAVDKNPKVVKNGAGGFHIVNRLDCNLKVGDKVKANDVIAADHNFFSNDIFGTRFNLGSLQKVACYSGYETFEDSTLISEKMAEDMASYIVKENIKKIGKNSNIGYIVNVGDKVSVGDELLRFEQSFDENTLNSFLSSVGEELKEEIKMSGQTSITSKFNGVIEDIKIYSAVELDEMSPSLREIVQKYYAGIKKKRDQLNKYDKGNPIYKCGILYTEADKKIELDNYGKIKGEECEDSVLICFYIKYKDVMSVGDKVTFYGPLKGTIGSVIPKGYEPYSEFRPEEEISSMVSANSVLQRMVPSIVLTGLGNKVIVELKRAIEEIYNE